MEHSRIFAELESEESISKKLSIYGYNIKTYHDFLLKVYLLRAPLPIHHRKKIKAQLKRLDTLKNRVKKTMTDVDKKIHQNLNPGKGHKGVLKPVTLMSTCGDSFISSINYFIEFQSKIMRERSGTPKLDYVACAVLSYVIKDGRGPRWFDIFETIRWFNKDIISTFGQEKSWLHTGEYDQEQLKEQSKYIKENPIYKPFIAELKNKFFPNLDRN